MRLPEFLLATSRQEAPLPASCMDISLLGQAATCGHAIPWMGTGTVHKFEDLLREIVCAWRGAVAQSMTTVRSM